MSFHIFKYSLKSLLKDRMSLFWMVLFPIILATLFNLAFQNILSGENFQKVSLAISTDDKMPEGLITEMDKSKLFNLTYQSENEAKKLLLNNEIVGYIKNSNDLELIIGTSGLNESIAKVFLDNYIQISTTVQNIATENPKLVQQGFFKNLSLNKDYSEEVPIHSSLNLIVVYYFALLAMTCLFSAISGSHASALIEANQTPQAARLNIAPTHKLKLFLSIVSATTLFQFMSALIAITYISQVLKVDFGDKIIQIIITCLVGSFTGTMFGAMFSSFTKFKSELKEMLLTNTIMIMCFLSGLMIVQLKYIVQQKAPILAYLNPANLITDSFYSLYYYETFDRFYINLSILLSMGITFCIVSILVLRRQKYASI